MKNTATKKKAAEPVKSLVIQEIRQVSVDRTPKDVSNWRNAHRAAESIEAPNRTRLYDLYEDVILDGYLTGVWQKRQAAATNKEIKFIDSAGKEVDALNTLMETEEWENLLNLILDSKLWGLSGVEFKIGEKFAYEEIPRKHILIEKGLIKNGQNDQTGIPYTDDSFVWVMGRKRDLGLLLKCSFYALIKKGNFADWSQYSEIFGQPIRVVKYDAFDDKTRIQLKQVLDESGSSLALMIPKQADFEIMDGKTSNGDGQLQERLKNACNNEMGIIILGNTETTGNDNGGSHAKAKEQGKQQLEITKKDIKFLLSQLNDDKFLNVLASYGYPVQGGKFAIQVENDPYKVAALVQTIAQVRQAGTPVSDDYVYEVTGIPKPDNYDEIKQQQEDQKAAALEAQKANQVPQKGKEREKEKDAPEDLVDSFWNKIRSKLADFFDPAP